MSNSPIHLTVKEITIVWHIEDVLGLRPDLSETQAMQVLRVAKKTHDANIGINWDVLNCVADDLFGNGH